MKRALIVGINYTGTGNDLRGCINDAMNMNALFKSQNFEQTKLLLEKEATTAGIMAGLKWLVDGVVPGDVIVFHYSGHGSQIRSTIEPDGLDEIICPIDLNWKDKVITDNELKQVFNSVPNGVNVTIILDCCHSGTALDQDDTMVLAKVQLHQETPLVEGESRFLPMPPEVEAYIREEKLELREFKTSRDVNRSALLIACCAPHQTSADAFLAGQYQGAGSHALQLALGKGIVSYRDLVQDMNAFMVKGGFTQRPQLDGHPSLYDQAFLKPWGSLFGTPTETPAPGTWVDPSSPAPAPAPAPAAGDKKPPYVAIVIAVLAALALFLITR
jgi:hypothetical protein